MTDSTKDKKRGRKPRGGFANLQDLFNCQQPSNNTQTFLPNTNLDTQDLPWNNNNISNTVHNISKPEFQQEIPLNDNDLDNVDLFPNDSIEDYENVYNIQTNFMKNKNNYTPLVADNVSNIDTSVPEHFRIVNINFNEPINNTPVQLSQNNNNNNNDFHHPLRVNFYTDENYKNASVCVLDDDISWPSSSPFACWWCAHKFQDFPKVIPINIFRSKENNKLHVEVIGNFCSWNCGKAYTIKHLRNLSMFHTFINHLYKENSLHIVAAPSPLCTKTFGGQLSIEEYRASFHNFNRRVSLQTLNQIHITVAKTFVFDSKQMCRI